MKDFRGMKRQRSRNRKPSGNQNNPNRAYESNGPEGTKVRGNAQTIYERYQQLARDANSAGDRVLAENHLQHAEHYFRMIRQMQPQRPVSEFVQRDPFSSGFDIDYDEDTDSEGNEGESDAVVDDSFQNDDRQRFDNRGNNGNGNNNRDRDNRDRDRNRQNGGQNGGQYNGQNGNQNGNRDRYNNNNNNNNEPRSFEPRNTSEPRNNNEPRHNGNSGAVPAPAPAAAPVGEDGEFFEGRRETRRERYERRRAQRLNEQELSVNGLPAAPAPAFIASTEPLGGANGRAAPVQTGPSDLVSAPAPEQPAVAAPVRERRERAPRPERSEARAEGVDADHLPAFIRKPASIAAAEPVAAEVEKPKRGRKPKVADVGAAEEA